VTLPDADALARLAVAGLGGLAVGIEREWSFQARGRAPRFAGVRTFLLLGLLGGLAPQLDPGAAGVALLVAAAALVVAAYIVAARAGDVDGTTEVAALLVLGAAGLAGTGRLGLASGLFALTALVLVEKSRMHALVARLQSTALEAGARFAVLALVVLPLLPEGPYGPSPGVRPRELWSLVLLFSGVSFAGYLALRATGPGRGYGLAGLLGGLVSSTAVTLTFSRESREQPLALGRALGLGVVAACLVLPIRMFALATVLNPDVGLRTAAFLAPPFLAGLAVAGVLLRRGDDPAAPVEAPPNPLRLGAAVQMAVAFQAVLYALGWMTARFGSAGLLASAAVLGLTDVDALTYSATRLQAGDPGLAARALAVGALANTLLKLGVAVALGHGPFRRVAAGGLGALAAAGAAALLAL
jgi:uncharacterized membrane protein (DUF4010 family)